MATYPIKGIAVVDPQSHMLGYLLRRHEEGATQTFPADSPLVMTSGYLVEAADPATAVFGFAKKEGQNGSAGANLAEFLPAYHGLGIYANFLATGGATNVLTQVDFGGSFELQKNAVGVGSANVWHAADVATNAALKMVSSESDVTLQDESEGRAAAGDNDARVSFILLDSVRTWK